MTGGDYVRGCGRYGLRAEAAPFPDETASTGGVTVSGIVLNPSPAAQWTFSADVDAVSDITGGDELELLVAGVWYQPIQIGKVGVTINAFYSPTIITSDATAWRVRSSNTGYTFMGGDTLAWPQQGTP
jgi:hypothetical protein